MKKYILIFCVLFITSCGKNDNITGETPTGELKSPCVSSDNGPCSDRFNPNIRLHTIKNFKV